MNAVEKLNALREKKAKHISGLELELTSVQSRIREAQLELRGIDASIREVSGSNGSLTGPESSAASVTPGGAGRYADMSLSPAVLDVVQAYGELPDLQA